MGHGQIFDRAQFNAPPIRVFRVDRGALLLIEIRQCADDHNDVRVIHKIGPRVGREPILPHQPEYRRHAGRSDAPAVSPGTAAN